MKGTAGTCPTPGQHAPAHQGRRPGEVSTKIKMIGRHMHGRVGFALPGHRILLACGYDP